MSAVGRGADHPSTVERPTAERPARGRSAARSRVRRRAPVVEDLLALRRRVGVSGLPLVLAAPLLVVSLFLPWSHQFSAAVLARYRGTAALVGIPHNPNAWQVYSTLDVALFLLGLALPAVAVTRGRRAPVLLLPVLAIALGFCAHASSVPPTTGAVLWNAAAHGYVNTGAHSGSGEVMALVALALASGGALLRAGARA